MNPLPPQAYTKETLLKAYQWVQSQAPAIRELATTPDLLVSLYLKASRDGDQSLDRPSIHNFKSELRSLSAMMGELERPGTPAAPPPPGASQLPPGAPMPNGAAATSSASPATPREPSTPSSMAPEARGGVSRTSGSTASDAGALQGLDAQSLEMLREIKERFNLSHESEALRMLVKIGYQKARGWMCEG